MDIKQDSSDKAKETSFWGRFLNKFRKKSNTDETKLKHSTINKVLKNSFCTNCGKRASKNDKFCPDCGNSFLVKIENSKLKRYRFGRIVEGFFISIGLAFLFGIISVIPSFFLASKNLPDKYYLISMVGTFAILTALTFIFTFKKKARRSSAIFLLIFVLLGSGLGFALDREVRNLSCKYSELNRDGMKSILNDYRKENSKNGLDNNEGLDSYAAHKADELADKAEDERKEKIINDFSEWYEKNVEESKRMRIKSSTAIYTDLANNPCTALDSFKTVRNINILDSKYTHFGISTKDDFVYMIMVEENRDPIPTPTPIPVKQNYQQNVPRVSSCDEARKSEQYRFLTEVIARRNKDILDLQSQVRQWEAKLQQPEQLKGDHEYARGVIDRINSGISDNQMNIRLREDDLAKVKDCKLFSDQWMETARKYY